MIWIVVMLGVLILLAFIFYLLLFLKFRKFINEDKDRIKMFSNSCLENLQEVSNGQDILPVQENVSLENNNGNSNNVVIKNDDF